VPDFLESGRHIAVVHGFVYVDISRPLTSAERSVIRQMDSLQYKIDHKETARVASSSLSGYRGSGDGWILFGWDYMWSVRQVGPYSGLTEHRTGVWISPWAGMLAGVIPWLMARSGQAWRMRAARMRKAAGLCILCGYDLRASTQRCPECGAIIPATSE
jgi:hypothetical protein